MEFELLIETDDDRCGKRYFFFTSVNVLLLLASVIGVGVGGEREIILNFICFLIKVFCIYFVFLQMFSRSLRQ